MSKATSKTDEKVSDKKSEDTPKASDVLNVGGDAPPIQGESNEPYVSGKDAKAERILASEARPLESEIVSNPGGESEVQFLQRLMLIQREGGWGSHLNEPIMARINLINGVDPKKNADEVEG